MFTLNFLQTDEIIRLDGPIRYYLTPEGHHYPSVTTVLDKVMPDDGRLQAWKDAVGIDEAQRITRVAAKRGDILHKTVEKYILDQDNFSAEKIMPTTRQQFNQIRKELNKSLSTVYGVEYKLYSDTFRIAGTTDLIGLWNGRMSIIDHKTGRSEKYAEDIKSYFIQETCYALMLRERRGITCEQIVTIIANDDTKDAQVFVENPLDHVNEAIKLIDEYHANV